jgi:predicted transcriptional regulator
MGETTLVGMAAKVVAAYVANNSIPSGELPNLFETVHLAFERIGNRSASFSASAQSTGGPGAKVGHTRLFDLPDRFRAQ